MPPGVAPDGRLIHTQSPYFVKLSMLRYRPISKRSGGSHETTRPLSDRTVADRTVRRDPGRGGRRAHNHGLSREKRSEGAVQGHRPRPDRRSQGQGQGRVGSDCDRTDVQETGTGHPVRRRYHHLCRLGGVARRRSGKPRPGGLFGPGRQQQVFHVEEGLRRDHHRRAPRARQPTFRHPGLPSRSPRSERRQKPHVLLLRFDG